MLIVISLLTVIVLQGYYAYQDFRLKTEDYQRDINTALVEAIDWADKVRIDSIQLRFGTELRDSSMYHIEPSANRDTVRIIDARTGIIRSSIIVRDRERRLFNSEELYELVLKRNRGLLEDNIVTYWADSLGKVLNEYMGTIRMSRDELNSAFDRALEKRSIASEYKLIYLKRDSVFEADNEEDIMVTLTQELRMADAHKVLAVFEKPFIGILIRSWKVLAISLLVLAILGYSFSFLLKTINRQRRLSELKDDFIDNVTHELLTPISTLSLALESMHKDEVLADTEKTIRYLNVSQLELNRISDLVQNVLLTSIYDDGKPSLNIQRFDLNQLIKGAIEYHKATSTKPLQVIFDEKDEVSLIADKQHFANVIHNLMDNAIKYSHEEGVEIKIDIEKKPDKIQVRLADNGKGIPKGDQVSVFDKFHRVVSNDVHDVKGLGVGLYYVKTILAQMNGDIFLSGSTKKGSTFLITMSNS